VDAIKPNYARDWSRDLRIGAVKELVQFQLSDGGSIIVEVEESESERGLTRAGRRADEPIIAAQQRLEDAIEVVRPAANAVLHKLRNVGSPPDEITVQFGIKLSFKAGAIIASSASEGNFNVQLCWRRGPGK